MSEKEDKGRLAPHGQGSGKAADKEPHWAKGLKQFYDSVVDEPLPDTFKDLLSKLDSAAKE